MLGPIDPFMYSPTWQLGVIIFLSFAVIYACGRITEYILRQLLLCMKYLFLSMIDLLYADDYEENNNPEDDNKRRKRETARRNRIAAAKSTILDSIDGTKTDVPVETILEVEVPNGDAVHESMRHSPTDDEEKSKNSSSSVSPTLRHRKGDVEPTELQSPPLTTIVS